MICLTILCSTSIESRAASGRTFGDWKTTSVTIDTSADDIFYSTPSVVSFNVSQSSARYPVTFTDMPPSNVHGITSAEYETFTFDFYKFSNSVAVDGIGFDSSTMDGFQISLSDFSVSSYSSSRIGSLSLVIGSNTSIADNRCVSVVNQPFNKAGQSSFLVSSDMLGPTAWYFWIKGSGAVASAYYPASSSSSIQYYRPSYSVKMSFTFKYRWYKDNVASSSDIQKNTDAVEKGNDLQKEANETSKGIFASIKDFFASFFSNLINSVISLFVPSSDEMSALFDQLNQFFSDRFGFLYAPFDYMIRLCKVFTSSTGSTSLTFPGFSIMGEQVWADQTYDLASDELVGTILGYVRTGTGILLAGYFIMFLQNFFKERFGTG